jgi:DNA-binding XRE family transcriptional regulator
MAPDLPKDQPLPQFPGEAAASFSGSHADAASSGQHQVGAFIRRRRHVLGLSCAQLAVLAGTTPASISRWENGRRSPNIHAALSLATALRVSIEDLVSSHHVPSGRSIPQIPGQAGDLS